MKSFKRMLSFFLVLSFSLLFLGTTGLAKNVKADSAPFTLSNGVYSGSGTTGKITWTENFLKIEQTKGSSSNNVNSSYVSAPRWYASHVITFTPLNESTITKVVIVCTSTTYATALNNSTWSTGITSTVSESTVTVTCNTTSSFTVNLGAQSRISSITYTYSSGATIVATNATISAPDNATNIVVKKTLQLTATPTPGNSTDKPTWSSSNTSIAKVSVSGLVTAVSLGTATIYAKFNDAVTAEYTVTVVLNPATSVVVTGSSNSVLISNTLQLTATPNPEDTTDKASWSSNNTAVATVDSEGLVTGVSEGSAVITCTYGEVNGVYNITVTSLKATSVSLDKKSISIWADETPTLTATTVPSPTSDVAVWTSSDESIATVSNGKITAKKGGTVTITCTYGSVSDSCEVEILTLSDTVQVMNWETYFKTGAGLTSGGYTANDGVHEGSYGKFEVKDMYINNNSLQSKGTSYLKFDYNYASKIEYILIKSVGTTSTKKQVPIVTTGATYNNLNNVVAAENDKIGDYFVFDVSSRSDYSFSITGDTDTVYIYEIKVYLRNYTDEFQSLNTLSTLSLIYTDNGDSTYTVNSLKLRFGTHNQITKELYDALVASGSTVTFGVELTVNGNTTGHTNTVVFVDANGNEVAKENAVYVNFSVVVPVTKAVNYDQLVVGQAYVSIDGVKYKMGEKTFSVDTLCDHYVNNKVSLGLSDEIESVLTYIRVML